MQVWNIYPEGEANWCLFLCTGPCSTMFTSCRVQPPMSTLELVPLTLNLLVFENFEFALGRVMQFCSNFGFDSGTFFRKTYGGKNIPP